MHGGSFDLELSGDFLGGMESAFALALEGLGNGINHVRVATASGANMIPIRGVRGFVPRAIAKHAVYVRSILRTDRADGLHTKPTGHVGTERLICSEKHHQTTQNLTPLLT